jgi:lipid-binding SYLF domain-containing protein
MSARWRRPMFRLLCVLGAALAQQTVFADWEPAADDKRQLAAAAALTEFRADPRLGAYFESAAGFAVFPNVVRAGFGTGVAHGRGVVIENDSAIGRSNVWELIHGIWGGAEWHRMIIFFKDAEAIDRFRSGNRWQFEGRAGAAIATVGPSVDPAFDRGVAIFTQTRGGLLLEATVGAAYYSFDPYQ